MRAKSLDELGKTLLYHNSVDVWMTLCSEKQWQWRDQKGYREFIDFLKAKRVSLMAANVSSPVRVFSDKSLSTYTLKLDEGTIRLIRTFEIQEGR